MDRYYSGVKALLYKHGIVFNNGEDYEKFMMDLADLFKI